MMAPSPALATREGAAKRWTGVHAGGLWSLEIPDLGCRRVHEHRKATPLAALFASRLRTPRGPRTPARVRSLHVREPGEPILTRPCRPRVSDIWPDLQEFRR